jgi:uncharacterized protein (TIGR02246 family)
VDKQEIERLDDETVAAWSVHDMEGVVGNFADDAVWNDLSLPEPLRGKDAIRTYVQGWFTAFPDITLTKTNRVVEGDQVAVELEFRGTNTGPMNMGGMEIPPTGKAVVGHGAYFARARNGKIVEFNAHPDTAGMMMQLGLMPGA